MALDAVEENYMEKNDDKDDEASHVRKEEEEVETKNGREGKEEEEACDRVDHVKEDGKREGDDGEMDKTSPIQVFSPKP